MADLESLKRLRRHVVDEKQKLLASLYRDADKLELQKKVIEDQMAYERKLAEEMKSPEAATFYGRYAEGARRKIRAVQESIRKMEIRIQAAQEDMRTAFAEFKKIDIVQRNRRAREMADIKKAEEKELDEAGIEGFRRKDET